MENSYEEAICVAENETVLDETVSDQVEDEVDTPEVTEVVDDDSSDDLANDESLAGMYVTTPYRLNMREGASTDHDVVAVLPKGQKCHSYGHYTTTAGTKWLLVTAKINDTEYKGFVSSKYLTKQ